MKRAMKWMLVGLSLMAAAGGFLAALGPRSATAAPPQGQPAIVPVYFTAVVGGDTPNGRRLLLRWFALEQLIQMETAVIYRSSASSPRQLHAIVQRIRDPKTIIAVFNRPYAHHARQDMNRVLERVFGPGAATDDDVFASRLVELLEGQSGSEAGQMRRLFLIQSNWGAAIVEGLGYLDIVPDAGPWTYELWEGDAAGTPQQALGQIVVNAAAATKLPAPANLREVQLLARGSLTEPSEANNQRIYLNWDVPPTLAELSNAMFGFDIYRLGRALGGGETFDSVFPELMKINESPVMPMPSAIEGEDPNQAYLFADWGDGLDGGDLLPIGQKYSYFAVPRDLLGQRGEPSNAVIVTVRDTSAPEPPKGLSVHRENDADGNPFLVAMWNRSVEDTVAYNIYRFQDYTHVQKKDPYLPIDGFTEGILMASIPQPATDKVVHMDLTVQTPAAVGRVFWYCVSAVDAHGNESALTPGQYGIIDDLVGPKIEGDKGRFCWPAASRTMINRVVLDQTTGAATHWAPRIRVVETQPCIRRLEIRRTDRRTGVVTHLPPMEFDLTGRVGGDLSIEIVDEIPEVTDLTMAPTYCFQMFDAAGLPSNEVCVEPPESWTPGVNQPRYDNIGACVTRRDCDNPDGGIIVVEPRPDQGIEINVPCTDGAESILLFRSFDCLEYELVGEFPCTGATADLLDTYTPEGLAEICFMIQGLDQNGNPGPKYFIPNLFIFNGEIAKPTLKSVKKAGAISDPHANLVWVGPKKGISHYNVYFKPDGGVDPVKPLEFSVGTTSYDPAKGEFTATALRADRDLNMIDPSQTYKVRVEAVAISNAKKASDEKTFNWGASDAQIGEFFWPPRPLPPIEPHPNNFAEYRADQKAVVVQMGTEPLFLLRDDPRTGIFPNVPFMVWRQRIDKANQPWLAISPLFEQIAVDKIDNSYFLVDPFFWFSGLTPGANDGFLFYKDNAGLVTKAQYRYYFVQLKPDSREILRLIGPIEVTLP